MSTGKRTVTVQVKLLVSVEVEVDGNLTSEANRGAYQRVATKIVDSVAATYRDDVVALREEAFDVSGNRKVYSYVYDEERHHG